MFLLIFVFQIIHAEKYMLSGEYIDFWNCVRYNNLIRQSEKLNDSRKKHFLLGNHAFLNRKWDGGFAVC